MKCALYRTSPTRAIICIDRLVPAGLELEVLSLSFVENVTVEKSAPKQFVVDLFGPCESWVPLYCDVTKIVSSFFGESLEDAPLEEVCEDERLVGNPEDR